MPQPSDIKPKSKIIAAIIDRVSRTADGLPPHRLIKDVSGHFQCSGRTTRHWLSLLVDRGLLGYAQVQGQPYVVMGRHRPVPVADRFALVPEHWAGQSTDGMSKASLSKRIPIRLADGASFGNGGHPTTRLALAGIAALGSDGRRPSSSIRILDVGTGTGVLILAAVLCLGGTGLGIDLDPVAVSEAAHHVRLNNLSNRIAVDTTPVEDIEGRFDVILANLRPPTLSGLRPMVRKHLAGRGQLLLTGGRPSELAAVEADYHRDGFATFWRAEDIGWAAVVLRASRK